MEEFNLCDATRPVVVVQSQPCRVATHARENVPIKDLCMQTVLYFRLKNLALDQNKSSCLWSRLLQA